MKNTNSTSPNEVIFVRQQNSFNLPKEETEYLVEKRNDFDEIEKLVRFFPVKDGTIELKLYRQNTLSHINTVISIA